MNKFTVSYLFLTDPPEQDYNYLLADLGDRVLDYIPGCFYVVGNKVDIEDIVAHYPSWIIREQQELAP